MLFITQSRKMRQVFVICFAFLAALRDAFFYSVFTLSLTTTVFWLFYPPKQSPQGQFCPFNGRLLALSGHTSQKLLAKIWLTLLTPSRDKQPWLNFVFRKQLLFAQHLPWRAVPGSRKVRQF
jgi:hypothetical protein